jgi:hypothetical protein
MNAQNATFTAEQIAQTIASMSTNFSDRKVTADDILNSEARDVVTAVAHDIVTSYTGTFSYMLNMRQYTALGLTNAQIAGVLNCAIADYRYNQRKAAVKQAETIVQTTTSRVYDHSKQYVADGWYTIQGNTSHRTVRLQTVKEDGNTVKQWLAYLNGSDNTGDYLTIGFVIGNEVKLFKKNEGKYTDIVAAARYLIKNGTKAPEYGKNYALRSGRCARCNKMLTVPLSITNGYGPKCSEAMGL